MDDEQLRKHAEFEAQHDCTVISPNLMQQIKPKQHFFYVVLQDQEGHIKDINHYDEYNTALIRAMDKAKNTGMFWSIFDLGGRFIDGSFNGVK